MARRRGALRALISSASTTPGAHTVWAPAAATSRRHAAGAHIARGRQGQGREAAARRERAEALLALGVRAVDALHGRRAAQHVRDQHPVGRPAARQHAKLVHNRAEQRVLVVAPRQRLARSAAAAPLPPPVPRDGSEAQNTCRDHAARAARWELP